ncbi:type IV pilin-like G/H family protein [Spirulina subsalsa FACHB-351]|uniref:Type IV pilin-like G/H family protein n=1 Tax=Spirulina subsalsa FACHB-351 TaxID=234711 RepID=A0ABT3L4Z5_9CYAN|nr:type IV pilin-like G/H family protein [Spirulina subsalsa]MCW6036568.1 type IV pilin-like G/H family protein [Spirulina subsalsa FACHB-351]
MTVRSSFISHIPSQGMLSWHKLLWLGSLVFLASCQLNVQIPPLDSGDRAQFFLKTVAKGQEGYYKANGEFATSLEKLSLNLKLDTPDYRYDLVSYGEPAESLIMTATAKEEGLESYAGVIYIQQNESEVNAVVNLCKTSTPSKTPPQLSPQPQPGQELKCPDGSVSVN